MAEHTVLVAFVVQADTMKQAQEALMGWLPAMQRDTPAYVDEWWIAEDERYDGSDNDSAVFVSKDGLANLIHAQQEDSPGGVGASPPPGEYQPKHRTVSPTNHDPEEVSP